MLELLCGPIACGKSTYAKHRASESTIVFNDDALMYMLHPNRYGHYDNSLISLYKDIEHTIIDKALTAGKNVIIDSHNGSRDRRLRLTLLAKCLGHKTILHLWPWTDPVTSGTKRFESDARGLSLESWINIAEHHYAQYEPPSLEEGYMDIFPHAG